MVEGGMSCVKYILFVFNFIFVIFGSLLIYFGFTVIQQAQDFKAFFETPDTMAIGVIIVGFFIFLIAFLGCCGAIIESYCVLVSFGIIVTVILTLELALAGLAFAFKSDLQSVAEHGVREAIGKYNFSDPENHFTRIIDDLQWNAKCCGATNVSDWITLQQGRIPASCCPKEFNESCSAMSVVTTTTPGSRSAIFGNLPDNSLSGNEPSSASPAPVINEHVYEQGCVQAAVNALEGSLGPVGGVCLAVALFQLLGVVFAFCLGRAVRREYQVV